MPALAGWRTQFSDRPLAGTGWTIEAPLALCQSDHLPLSEPALAIKEILLDLAAGLPGAKARPAGKKAARRT